MNKDILADRTTAYNFIRSIFKNLDRKDVSVFNRQLSDLLKVPIEDLNSLSEGKSNPSRALVNALKHRFDSDKDVYISFGIYNVLVVPFIEKTKPL